MGEFHAKARSREEFWGTKGHRVFLGGSFLEFETFEKTDPLIVAQTDTRHPSMKSREESRV